MAGVWVEGIHLRGDGLLVAVIVEVGVAYRYALVGIMIECGRAKGALIGIGDMSRSGGVKVRVLLR